MLIKLSSRFRSLYKHLTWQSHYQTRDARQIHKSFPFCCVLPVLPLSSKKLPGRNSRHFSQRIRQERELSCNVVKIECSHLFPLSAYVYIILLTGLSHSNQTLFLGFNLLAQGVKLGWILNFRMNLWTDFDQLVKIASRYWIKIG